MRIQFISNYSSLYGANKVLLSTVEYFHTQGYTVSVLLPSKGEIINELKRKNIRYRVVPNFSGFLYVKKSGKYLSLPLLWLLDTLMFFPILFKIKKFAPDIIYSNTSAENIGILIAKLLRVKHISHIHEFMSLDHGAYFIGGPKAKQKYIGLSDGIIYVSKCVASFVNLRNPLSANSSVIYNGVADPCIELKEKIPAKGLNFGIVGILDPAKGQDTAIHYFKDLEGTYPDSKLHIFGDKKSPYREYLKKIVIELNLQNKVIFHGFVRNIEDIYGYIDVLFMFSRSEGFGLVTVEAMLYGVPVLGLNSAGTAEIIADKLTGYLFKDLPSFKYSLALLLTGNNYATIRENAFIEAKNRFSENLYGQKIEQFVKSIYISTK